MVFFVFFIEGYRRLNTGCAEWPESSSAPVAGERAARIFRMKILGTETIGESRSQMRYSPESILWAVIQMFFCAMGVWLDEYGDECLAYLNGNPDNRNANLNRVAYRWSRIYRVLALR